MSIEKPLAGITIIEAVSSRAPAALGLAAGMCGRLAHDLGARVVRLEPGNAMAAQLDGFLHSGKERVQVPDDGLVAALERAAAQADGVVADLWLCEAGDVGQRGAVALAMSHDSPHGGSEFTLEARSGLLDLVGDPRKQPLRLGGHQIAYAAGMAAYLALVDMLTKRGEGTEGLFRRVDLLDIAVWLNWKAIGGAALGLPVPMRMGSDGDWSVAPCRDGYVALVYRSSDWQSFKTMLQDARLDDVRYDTEAGRREHRAALNVILREAIAPLDRADIRRLSLQYRVPLGPVWTPAELRDDPHFLARDFFHPRTRGATAIVLPAVPVKWNGTTFPPGEPRRSLQASA